MKEHRQHQRVRTHQPSWISSDRISHAATIEDMSMGGALMRITDGYTEEDEFWDAKEDVFLQIDEGAPLKGHVVRMMLPRVAIQFDDLGEDELHRLADELATQWRLHAQSPAAAE